MWISKSWIILQGKEILESVQVSQQTGASEKIQLPWPMYQE